MGGPHKHHDDVLKRLRRAAGHLEKVIAMIEEGQPCLDTSQQLHAVHKALGNAKNLYVRDHIEHCMDPAAIGDLRKAQKVIEEIREISKYL